MQADLRATRERQAGDHRTGLDVDPARAAGRDDGRLGVDLHESVEPAQQCSLPGGDSRDRARRRRAHPGDHLRARIAEDAQAAVEDEGLVESTTHQQRVTRRLATR